MFLKNQIFQIILSHPVHTYKPRRVIRGTMLFYESYRFLFLHFFLFYFLQAFFFSLCFSGIILYKTYLNGIWFLSFYFSFSFRLFRKATWLPLVCKMFLSKLIESSITTKQRHNETTLLKSALYKTNTVLLKNIYGQLVYSASFHLFFTLSSGPRWFIRVRCKAARRIIIYHIIPVFFFLRLLSFFGYTTFYARIIWIKKIYYDNRRPFIWKRIK